MTNKEQLLQEIAQAPDDLIEELIAFLHTAKAHRSSTPVIFSGKRRSASVAVAGKGKTLADLVSPILDEQDWECLK